MIIKVIGCGEDKPISVKIKDLQRVDRVIGDYGDLTGKPEINGHELVGNLSTSDLGIQTYVKPADGIPKEDLSEEVQDLLERETGKFYMLEADVGAIIYKAGAPVGEIFTPSTITVDAYQVDSSGKRSSVEADVLTYECMTKDGYPIETGSWSGACYATVALPQTDIEAMTVQFEILKLSEFGFLDTVASLKIPVIPAGQDGASDDSLKALSKSFDIEELQFIEGKRINNSGSTIDVTVFNNNASWKCCVVDCSPGDIFTVSSVGGTTYRAWAFVSSSGQNLMAAESGASCSNLELVAPENASKLTINDTISAGNVCYRGRRLQKTIDQTEETVNKMSGDVYVRQNLTFEYGTINAAGQPSTSSTIIRSADYHKCAIGDVIIFNHIFPAANNGYLYFYDNNKNYLRRLTFNRGTSYTFVNDNECYFKLRLGAHSSGTIEEVFEKIYDIFVSIRLAWSDIRESTKELDRKINGILRHGSKVRSIAHKRTTLEQIISTKEAGYQYIECDVNITKDLVHIICHDPNLANFTGSTVRSMDGYIAYKDINNNPYWYDETGGEVYQYINGEYQPTSVDIATLTQLSGSDVSFSEYNYNDFIEIINIGTASKPAKILTLREYLLYCKELGLYVYCDRKNGFGVSNNTLGVVVNTVLETGMGNYVTLFVDSDGAQAQYINNLTHNIRMQNINEITTERIELFSAYKDNKYGFCFDPPAAFILNNPELAKQALRAGFEVETYYIGGANPSQDPTVAENIRKLVEIGVQGITLDSNGFVEDAFDFS